MYSTPADWGITEPMLTVLFSHQERAIALSDNGELFYSEMPEEYNFPGSVLPISDAAPIQELPENERQEIQRLCRDILARYRFDWEVSHHEEKL